MDQILVMTLKLSSPMRLQILLAALLISTAGAILQIGGASWDITSHILRQPETFFTPSHAVLYAGAGLTTTAAAVGLFTRLKNRELMLHGSYHTAFTLLIVGAVIQLVSGPGDFVWHSVYGVDGLMSPPHLSLATGILISSIASVLGLARISPHLQEGKTRQLARISLAPAFAAFWFSTIWYIFMFVLPLSNGEHFSFNPDPAVAIVIATAVLPFVSALIFVVSSRAIGKVGAASAVAGLVIGMNLIANIIPAYDSLGAFVPWQMLAIAPAIVGADIAMHKLDGRRGVLVAGALIGITFYVFNYPMLPMAFAEFLHQPNASVSDTLPSMYATLSQVVILTAVPSMLAGIVGAIIGSRRIRVPQVQVAAAP